jgi:large subunit ribosomal protein L10
MVNQLKKTQVATLLKTLEEKTNFLLVKIGKTTHQSLESLRKDLKKTDSSIRVIKNTLFEKTVNKIALKKPVFSDLKKRFFPLRESSALVTFKDGWDKGLKTFYQFSKKETSLGFKMALLDDTLYDSKQVLQIAQLPTKDELLGKIIGSMKSPMSKFVYALKYNTNKLVYILQEKSKVKN